MNSSRPPHWLRLLGPAFVAAVAYVDPGNVAANLTAGAKHGYTLVWVLVVASAMAVIIQYQSAKLGLVTGRSLAELTADSLSHRPWLRVAYTVQAFAMAIATDVAEVVGGALALYLLWQVPLPVGGVVIGLASVLILFVIRGRDASFFERGVTAMLLLVVAGFMAATIWAGPDWLATLRGALPSPVPPDTWPLIGAMLGATVMPHAIYLHSSLAIDRHRPTGRLTHPLPFLLRVQRLDVVLALIVAGTVNISMILLAAAALTPEASDTIEQAHAMLGSAIGSGAALLFALGLLISGLGSAVVGTESGTTLLRELTSWNLSPLVRRSLTLIPAVAFLMTGLDATTILVLSQLILSFGIALAAGPLAYFTARKKFMGDFADSGFMRTVNYTIVGLVIALNMWLIIDTFLA